MALTILGLFWLALVTLGWGAILVRALREDQSNPFRLGPEDPRCAASERVSVVIPARDEERNIEAAVRGVLDQDHPGLELVVLDDGSTDRTAEILQGFDDPRLKVVDGGGEGPPEGWLGKPWACHRASAHATGEWLLFVDADVRLHPHVVSRAVAYARAHDLGLLSGLGTVEQHSLAEKVLQPAITGLIIAGNDLAEVNDPDKPDKALANGQLLLFHRFAYEAIDGHQAVAANVIDDVGLALAVKRAGLPYHLLFMRQLFSTRMYTSLAEIWAGWRKNLFAGMHRSWLALVVVELGLGAFLLGPYLVVLLVILGLLDPLFLLGALPAVLAIQATRWVADGIFGLPRGLGQLTHALAYALVALLLVDSAISTSLGLTRWKGRAIQRRV